MRMYSFESGRHPRPSERNSKSQHRYRPQLFHLGSDFSLGNDAHGLLVATRATSFAPPTELLLYPPLLACYKPFHPQKKETHKTLLLQPLSQDPRSTKDSRVEFLPMRGCSLASVHRKAASKQGSRQAQKQRRRPTGKLRGLFFREANCSETRDTAFWWLGLGLNKKTPFIL